MGNSFSPEEKLLRLIKGQKSAPAKTSFLLSPKEAPAALKPVPKTILRDNLRRILNFFTLNRVINIAFVLAGIYLIVSLIAAFSGYKNVEAPPAAGTPAANKEAVANREPEPKEGKLPFDFYNQAAGGRSIFALETPPAESPTESAINNDAIKDINIVGIIADSNPQVIIEDRKTQKTHYVTKGQYIGEFKVEEIQEGKVILNSKGQRFELYL